MRIGALAVLLSLAVAGAAGGAFETLPGPAPCGAASWAWPAAEHAGRRWNAGAAVGRPADVEDLVWTHLWVRRCRSRWHLTLDAFGLGLADLYREQAIGLTFSTSWFDMGCRRWQVAWAGDLRRGGWTGSAEARVRRGRTLCRVILQDIGWPRPDPAGPRPTIAAAVTRSVASALKLSAAVRRDRLGSASAWSVRWIPAPWAEVTEEYAEPGIFTTGVELRASGMRTAIWAAPIPAIGTRTGVTVSWGF